MSRDRLTLWELMLLIAGVAVGLWTMLDKGWDYKDEQDLVVLIIVILGGFRWLGHPS